MKTRNKKGIVKNDASTSKVPISNNINSEAIAAALSTTNLPVLLKVCRLCETKDGPFLNIFDIDKVIAKKIEDIMPFVVAENDDLPHKICFRCSAKVEELYEFIQKCVKTQINLRRAMGNKTPLPAKVKQRTLWEEKLNESNISNEDICDALIKKAMESIKEPLKDVTPEEETKTVIKKQNEKNTVKETLTRSSSSLRIDNSKSEIEDSTDDSDIPLKKLKLQIKKVDHSKFARTEKTPKIEKSILIVEKSVSNDAKSSPKVERVTRKSEKCDPKVENSAPKVEKKSPKDKKSEPKLKKSAAKSILLTNCTEDKANTSECKTVKTNTFSLDTSTKLEDPKPFNILDHTSMIKVNSVGVLYQCKLCNRNFLKKDGILTHGCAKNGGLKKRDLFKEPPKPDPPKLPTVKYINTKVNNIEPKQPVTISEPIILDDDEDDVDSKPIKPQVTKPRIGPASKVKKNFDPDPPSPETVELAVSQAPVVQFPQAPSINSRYKLLPGPNNTFTLVEEGSENSINSPINPVIPSNPIIPEPVKAIKHSVKLKASKEINIQPLLHQAQAVSQPYPVGLFQTVPHNSNSTPTEPPTFTTSIKKQSYTIVQTDNPNKLLISTKTQPEYETPKKKSRKSKLEPKTDESLKEPFSVTLEDAAPPRDSGFFTFINVDPLLQPSYVLPTDSIVQESQITTINKCQKKLTPTNDKANMYTCNLCNSMFAREKTLLAHIQSHYNEMDKEDEARNATQRTRSKK